MHNKSRRFPSRLCVDYARGWVECETVETVKVQKKKKNTDRFGFSSVEIDFSEVPREKRSRFALVLFGTRCHLTH